MLLLWMTSLLFVTDEPQKRIVLDTDVDTDDFFAMLYLLKLNRSEFDLEIIDFDMDEELRPKIALKLHGSNESLVMTQNRATLHIDYKTGFVMEPGGNSFEIVRIDFDIRFYKFNSSMIAWQLVQIFRDAP
ncbi:inosine-uridine preferring nucleoside hydrolase [Artemisia annua]|uniref:Inosine-uridine preferring nucleoside hydrolase n=1 Tax=Artemisia annua TaxID=35608 RepID=A0A2U1N0F5_ARTAN|nr:inosine-uridine preferring nucleoside hydrolase [Artemisia annua]